MTTKTNFKRMFEEAEKAPAFSEEERRAQANIWNWNMESNIKIWNELAKDSRNKREWNEFAKFVLKEIQEYAEIMKEVKK
jgi:hypothetical protein